MMLLENTSFKILNDEKEKERNKSLELSFWNNDLLLNKGKSSSVINKSLVYQMNGYIEGDYRERKFSSRSLLDNVGLDIPVATASTHFIY